MRTLRTLRTQSVLALIAIGTMVVQPLYGLDIPTADDAQVIQANPSWNYGGADNLRVDSSAGAGRWTFIRFDINSYLPPGGKSGDVKQALLHLYVNNVTQGGTFDVYLCPTSWIEGKLSGAAAAGTICWNNKPTPTGVPLATISISSTEQFEFKTLDVTDVVKGWIDAPAANYGLVLKPNISAVDFQFEAKENITGTGKRPALQLTLVKDRVPAKGDVTMGSYTNGPQP